MTTQTRKGTRRSKQTSTKLTNADGAQTIEAQVQLLTGQVLMSANSLALFGLLQERAALSNLDTRGTEALMQLGLSAMASHSLSMCDQLRKLTCSLKRSSPLTPPDAEIFALCDAVAEMAHDILFQEP